jgi:hypothetical protein
MIFNARRVWGMGYGVLAFYASLGWFSILNNSPGGTAGGIAVIMFTLSKWFAFCLACFIASFHCLYYVVLIYP